jgi:glutamate-1-semialdehyde 2,1-aminomutase
MTPLFKDWQPHRHKKEYLDLGQPLTTTHADGAIVYCDNKEYIDFVMGWGTIILGHSNQGIAGIISKHLNEPLIVNNHTDIELSVARSLSNFYNSNYDVSFFMNGSDVTTSAVRVSRALTKKKRVLFRGYHGWHDWAQPKASGVIDYATKYSSSLKHDADDIYSEIEEHADQLACVILETPLKSEKARDVLTRIKALSKKHGFLLVFDEIKTTMRCGFAYGRDVYGVNADIVLLGKACAGGLPLSIMLTDKRIAESVQGTRLIGSYWGSPMSLHVFEYLFNLSQERDIVSELELIGINFRNSFNKIFMSRGIPISLSGQATMPVMEFDSKAINILKFYKLCFKHGIYVRMPPHCWFISLAHTLELCEEAISRFNCVAKEL